MIDFKTTILTTKSLRVLLSSAVISHNKLILCLNIKGFLLILIFCRSKREREGQEVIWPGVGQTIFLSGSLGTLMLPQGPRGPRCSRQPRGGRIMAGLTWRTIQNGQNGVKNARFKFSAKFQKWPFLIFRNLSH